MGNENKPTNIEQMKFNFTHKNNTDTQHTPPQMYITDVCMELSDGKSEDHSKKEKEAHTNRNRKK